MEKIFGRNCEFYLEFWGSLEGSFWIRSELVWPGEKRLGPEDFSGHGIPGPQAQQIDPQWVPVYSNRRETNLSSGGLRKPALLNVFPALTCRWRLPADCSSCQATISGILLKDIVESHGGTGVLLHLSTDVCSVLFHSRFCFVLFLVLANAPRASCVLSNCSSIQAITQTV